MSPAGLYRYYDGRDALLTDLLADAYRDLARAVADCRGPPDRASRGASRCDRRSPSVADPIAAMLRAIEAYREWAVTNRARFLLIFGTPVPGYSAPEDGPTVAGQPADGPGVLHPRRHGLGHGRIAPPPRPTATAELTPGEAELHAQLEALAPGFPAGLIPQMLAGWALWHGLVTLEVTGQMDWIYPDTARLLLRADGRLAGRVHRPGRAGRGPR